MTLYTANVTYRGEQAGTLTADSEVGVLRFAPNAWGRRNLRAIQRELRSVRKAYMDAPSLEMGGRPIRRVVIDAMTEISGDGA